MQLVLADCMENLAVDHRAPLDKGRKDFMDSFDAEAGTDLGKRPTEDDMRGRLLVVSDRLRNETAATPATSRSASPDRDSSSFPAESPAESHASVKEKEKEAVCDVSDHIAYLKLCWQRFKDEQNYRVTEVLSSGVLASPDEMLETEKPRSSAAETMGYDPYDSKEDGVKPTKNIQANASVMRVKSFLFGLDHFLEELIEVHASMQAARKQSLRVRVHFAESFRPSNLFKKKGTAMNNDTRPLTRKEALAML